MNAVGLPAKYGGAFLMNHVRNVQKLIEIDTPTTELP
jgi:hypothetical protein